MNLNIDTWKPFITAQLFPVLKPGKANQQLLDEGNDCFYIGAKKDDNGVMLHCAWDESLVQKGNCVIFICNGQGSVGYANYMDRDFIGTTDIVAGYNENLNPLIGNFLATVYSLERPKYSFGRKWKTHLKATEIKLPVLHNEDGSIFIDASHKYSDEGYVPDWDFMERYIKSLRYKSLTTNNIGKSLKFEFKNCREFKVSKILSIRNGKGITSEELETYPGNLNAVQSGEENNGVIGRIDINYCKDMGYTYCTEPCLTVARTGSAGFVSFQKEGCVVGDSAKILLLDTEHASIGCYLFIQTLLLKNRFKYDYGRKVTEDKYMKEIIVLPVLHNEDGSIFIDASHKYSDEGYIPDWTFMENYIKSLPYGDRI